VPLDHLQESRKPCYRRENRCKFRYVSNFTTASCGFSVTPRLSCTRYISDRSNVEIRHSDFRYLIAGQTLCTQSTLIFTALAVTQNHGDSRKSR